MLSTMKASSATSTRIQSAIRVGVVTGRLSRHVQSHAAGSKPVLPSSNVRLQPRLLSTSFLEKATSRLVCSAAAAPTAEGTTIDVDLRIPVTIITGFLGSGKTTLLNHILTQDHGRRIAVIENEFGEINIDSELVAKREVLEGTTDTITMLSNGCLCCTVRDDLIKALNKLYDRRNEFDHIVIETTGLANPAPIISSFYADARLPDRVRLDGVVTVVDAKFAERHLNEEKPEGVVNEAVEQIAYADRIVLNKTDLVTPAELKRLEGRVRGINELASMQRTQRSVVPVDYVLGVGGFDLARIDEAVVPVTKPKASAHNHDHDHHHEHDHDHANCAKCAEEGHDHDHHNHSSHDHDHHDHDHSAHAHDHSAHASHDSHDDHDHGHSHDSHDDHDHEHVHVHGPDCAPDCGHDHSHDHDATAAMKHDDLINSVSLVIDGDMDLNKINYAMGLLLENRNEDIYRMKGILAVEGSEFRFVYQGVHSMFEGVADRKWQPGEKRQSRMVFIGRELNRQDFEEAFKSCVVKEQRKPAGAGAGL